MVFELRWAKTLVLGLSKHENPDKYIVLVFKSSKSLVECMVLAL